MEAQRQIATAIGMGLVLAAPGCSLIYSSQAGERNDGDAAAVDSSPGSDGASGLDGSAADGAVSACTPGEPLSTAYVEDGGSANPFSHGGPIRSPSVINIQGTDWLYYVAEGAVYRIALSISKAEVVAVPPIESVSGVSGTAIAFSPGPGGVYSLSAGGPYRMHQFSASGVIGLGADITLDGFTNPVERPFDTGTVLYVSSGQSGSDFDLYAASAQNGTTFTQTDELAAFNGDCKDFSPVVASDGKSLFFSSNRKPSEPAVCELTTRIFRADLTSEAQPVVVDLGGVGAVAPWLHYVEDGGHIVFATGETDRVRYSAFDCQ